MSKSPNDRRGDAGRWRAGAMQGRAVCHRVLVVATAGSGRPPEPGGGAGGGEPQRVMVMQQGVSLLRSEAPFPDRAAAGAVQLRPGAAAGGPGDGRSRAWTSASVGPASPSCQFICLI
ncbi:protein of unknown function [Cupriavidus neocaledonicus]|uniref:Uncharacterized protein n=1 Tax=Cupriavidus neocaledonicus TaxID=1040979 RepID=A0A375H669_9BURK|nr:protein of unknown function [Cupriavidus neocaledonicus]